MTHESDLAKRLAHSLTNRTQSTKLVIGPEGKTKSFMSIVERELYDTTQSNLPTFLFAPINVSLYQYATRASEAILESIVEKISEHRQVFRLRFLPREYRKRSSGDVPFSFSHSVAGNLFFTFPSSPRDLLHMLNTSLSSRGLHMIVVVMGIDEFSGCHNMFGELFRYRYARKATRKNIDPILNLLYYLEKEDSISTVITSSAGLNVDPKLFLHETVQIG